MIYNANNQNDPGRSGPWVPPQSDPATPKTSMSNTKLTAIILGGFAIISIGILFWVGMVVSVTSDTASSSGTASSSNRPVAEQEYLDLLYEAHREDGDRGHTFANDSEAVAHGYTVCELLDTYYIEDIADAIAINREGILRGVSMESKAYGIAAASIKLCPEHLPEVRRWMN